MCKVKSVLNILVNFSKTAEWAGVARRVEARAGTVNLTHGRRFKYWHHYLIQFWLIYGSRESVCGFPTPLEWRCLFSWRFFFKFKFQIWSPLFSHRSCILYMILYVRLTVYLWWQLLTISLYLAYSWFWVHLIYLILVLQFVESYVKIKLKSLRK